MATFTPNYGWNLPAVNSATDEDLWGTELNSNFSSQDTIIKAIADSATTPSDTAFIIHNAVDATKQGRFSLTNVTTGTTAVYTMPSASTSLIGTTTTDTLTNKTLTSPALTGTPTAPTATLGTNTTQVATTAFVQAAVDAATDKRVYAWGYIDATPTVVRGDGIASVSRIGTGVIRVVLSDGTKNYTVTVSRGEAGWTFISNYAAAQFEVTTQNSGGGLINNGFYFIAAASY